MDKNIVETKEEAEKIFDNGIGEYGGRVQLTVEDLRDLLRGKFIVTDCEEYSQMIFLAPDELSKFSHFDLSIL